MMGRLPARLWIDAHLRLCNGQGMMAVIQHKGDRERGGILLHVDRLNGVGLLLEQTVDMDGRRFWRGLGPESGLSDAEITERIAKRRRMDPDLWVLVVEDPRGDHVLDDPVVFDR
ncbi:DUF1491 family protein [Yunchengibacter salinarum]|uniref:DUF1491 family protein n=1 Tax=Yunchengibacter salinarum TaxID=3133399 RepID=UPI0035B65A09